MKRLIPVLLLLFLSSPVYGDDFQDGVDAYKRGDYKEAVKWYRLSAEQGYATAQYNLGLMYSKGRGVIQDYVQAHKWFNLAGANGNEQDRKNRDIIEKRMTPNQIAEAQKLAREWTEKHGKK